MTSVSARVTSRDPRRPADPPLVWVRAHAPVIAGHTATVLGLSSLVDAAWPHRWQVISGLGPIAPPHTMAAAQAIVAVVGLLLLRIARGLRQRKHAVWRVAVVACSALIVIDLARDVDRTGVLVVTGALLALLVLARDRFTARSDPRSRLFAFRFAAQLLAASLGYGVLLLYLPGHVRGSYSLWSRLQEIVLSLVGLGGKVHITDDAYADSFHATLCALGLLTVVCTALLALRPQEPPATLSAADETRLRSLLARHGERDSLGYFALRRDKSAVWSDSGKAAITYRVVYGVALVSGDPIGDPEAWPGAIAAYQRMVTEYGWTPAVMGCSELGAVIFKREAGLSALALGDEAVVEAARFTLAGRPMRGIRQACTRLERAGYTSRVCRVGDLDDTELERLRAAADAWRGDTVERGYSMALSRLGDGADTDCLAVLAYQHGELRGLLHFVPWSTRGISLDLMRRDRAAENGLNEFMITELMAACPAFGIEHVSLNFAVFRDALERGERVGAGPVARLWRRLLLIASRWWQIDSLYRFNAKFQPIWVPRFVCYPGARDLPRIALAALEAEAFVVRPQRLRRLVGRG